MSNQSDLADLIRSKFVGVEPDSQDTVLEDHDWRLILAALQPSSAADAKPVAVVAVPRLDMKVAIADAIWRYDNGEFTAARVAMVKAQDILSRAQPHPSQQAGADGEINEWVSAEVANNIHGSMAGDEVVTAECAVEIARGAALRALAALKPVEG